MSKNSYRTIIRDSNGEIVAEWFSLNPKSDRERLQVAEDIAAVVENKK